MRSTRLLLAAAVMIVTPTFAFADCKADIDKVEATLGRADSNGIDFETGNQMRALLQKAYEAHRQGNEAVCQDLIDQAKSMGGVE
ncbi:hypothetical protein [uncultured Roseibium sp.]|uniref:hypothetical protein n=1 Tax=uncultured Roseibium sp. TaxID=1936171 RepID=UPI003216F193